MTTNVFPTGIDTRPGARPGEFDVYYGMADERVGLISLRLGALCIAAPHPAAA
jgi:hypothetical protein